MGERFAVALTHGSMSVEYYSPIGHDPQTPHEQDEVYFTHRGTGELAINGDRHLFKAGDCLFVPANIEHRFENFSSDFGTWVLFWGPSGGETERERGRGGEGRKDTLLIVIGYRLTVARRNPYKKSRVSSQTSPCMDSVILSRAVHQCAGNVWKTNIGSTLYMGIQSRRYEQASP